VTSTGPKEATFPTALVPFATRVERRIDDLLGAELARWQAVDIRLAEPIEALRGFVATGGKRLRPAFCYCAFVGADGESGDPRVVDAAAALELVHTFALAHDDVMDGSEMRRGTESVHTLFAQRHVRAGWRGEPRRFGEGMAILVGDFAFTYADMLMRGMPDAAHVVFDELRVELCVGQSLDLAGTAAASTEADLANRIAVYKSGKYTVERPLHLGAALADGLAPLGPALSEIGLPLGHAFQLRDDVLGAFGNAEITGKPVGDDLREGKPTPLVALAFARADAADRELLRTLGDPDLSEGDIESLQAVFVRTGALDEIEADIARLVAEAREALANAPIAETARGWLDELAAYVAWRDR
jgi:geranylgeranyl diphosphate synthase, type I